MNETTNVNDEMMKIIMSKWISKSVHAAASLGIADLLLDGEKSIESLRKITGTNADMLYRLLRALAGVGIFTEVKEKVFANTPMSETLTENRLKYISLMFESECHSKTWDNLLFSIKKGQSSFEEVFGENAFSWFAKHPDQAEYFYRANGAKSFIVNGTIAKGFDFSHYRKITDVGGGHGELMAAITEIYPDISGMVADLPEVVKRGQERMKETGNNRVVFETCDFFKAIPEGSDLYIMCNILHDFNDEQAKTILKNLSRVMSKNQLLLVAEAIVPDGNDFSVAKFLDLEVFLMGGGKERTHAAFDRLFSDSGFKINNITDTESGVSLLEIKKNM